MHLLNLLFFILASFSQTVYSRSNTSIIPITKDDQTSLHKVPFDLAIASLDQNQGPYLVIDLDTPYLWKDIQITHSPTPCAEEDGCRLPVRCDTTLCKESKSYTNPKCPSPNSTNCSMCPSTPFNPVSNACEISQLTTDLLRPAWTNGTNPSSSYPGFPFGGRFVLSCAPESLKKSFPNDVRGVAGFSWSGLCLPRQLVSTGVTNTAKFALCLPSSTKAHGVTFLGDGPFYFTSNPKLDLRSVLSYTPMVRKNSKSLGYYVKINRILIKGTSVGSVTKGTSVKISSIVTYTTLRTDIYKAVVAGLSKGMGEITKVPLVKPFGFCFKDSAVGSGGVPKIDLEMESGKIWSISVENSVKRVGNGVACLAFVDGGAKVSDPIVIGTFQMENNFLYFDLVNQKLGFSSSLLARGTSCSGFNFTVVGN